MKRSSASAAFAAGAAALAGRPRSSPASEGDSPRASSAGAPLSSAMVAAEKLLNRETVYRMGAPTVDQTEPAAFTLPDGTVLET